MKVGIVGCGNIASDICRAIREKGLMAEVVALTDVDVAKAETLRQDHDLNAVITSLDKTVAAVDYVVECAVGIVVPEVLQSAIKYRVDCLIMSVGGFMSQPELLEEARKNRVHVWLPTGAVCGIDGIRSAMQAGLESVTLTTRKPPRGLVGAPYLKEHNIDVEHLSEPLIVFDGTAREAVKAFPANVNVAAALSLAGIGPDATRVRLVADPDATMNTHEIHAVGAFGELTTVTQNRPSPRNPKSSYMASLSASAEVAAAAAVFAARES
ncbi:MAG: aspartate dehydrogenase [Candidatus Hydrogenedentes bacterium]|nr:aspartate dehydrogenase [Candidatus Hydrogenedentota bacterium]